MGEGQRVLKNERRIRLYALVGTAGLILFGALLLGINILTSDEPVERAATPETDLASETEGLQRAAEQKAAFIASAMKAAAEEAAKQEAAERVEKEAAPRAAPPCGSASPGSASRAPDRCPDRHHDVPDCS
jgi:hypothetical protein